MAEVVGIVGTVATLAAEGLKLSNTLHTFYKSAKNAEKDVNVVSKELKDTALVLRQLESILKEESRLCSNEFYKSLDENINDCRALFEDIGNLLVRCGGERKDEVSVNEISLGAKFALKWPLNSVEVKQLCSELDKLKWNISLKLGVIRYQREVHESQIADLRRESLERETTYNVRIEKHNIEILKLRTKMAQERYETLNKSTSRNTVSPETAKSSSFVDKEQGVTPNGPFRNQNGVETRKHQLKVSFSPAPSFSTNDKQGNVARYRDLPQLAAKRDASRQPRSSLAASGNDRNTETNTNNKARAGYGSTSKTSISRHDTRGRKMSDPVSPPKGSPSSFMIKSLTNPGTASKDDASKGEAVEAQRLRLNGSVPTNLSATTARGPGNQSSLKGGSRHASNDRSEPDVSHTHCVAVSRDGANADNLSDDSNSKLSARSKTSGEADTSPTQSESRGTDLSFDDMPEVGNVMRCKPHASTQRPLLQAATQTVDQFEETHPRPEVYLRPGRKNVKSKSHRSPFDNIKPWFRNLKRIGSNGHDHPRDKRDGQLISGSAVGRQSKIHGNLESHEVPTRAINPEQHDRSQSLVTGARPPQLSGPQDTAPAIDQRWSSSALFTLPLNSQHFRPFEGPPYETRNVGDRIIYEMLPVVPQIHDEQIALELWQFQRLIQPPNHEESWGHVTRHYLPVDASELQREVRRFKGWHGSVTRAFNRLTTYQQRQIHLLLYERDIRNRHVGQYQWTIQAVKTLPRRSKPAVCNSMQVIIERRDLWQSLLGHSPNQPMPQMPNPFHRPPQPQPQPYVPPSNMQAQMQQHRPPQPQPQSSMPASNVQARVQHRGRPTPRQPSIQSEPSIIKTGHLGSHGHRTDLSSRHPSKHSARSSRAKSHRYSESSMTSSTESLLSSKQKTKGFKLIPHGVNRKPQSGPKYPSHEYAYFTSTSSDEITAVSSSRKKTPGSLNRRDFGSIGQQGPISLDKRGFNSPGKETPSSLDTSGLKPAQVQRKRLKEKASEDSFDDLISKWTLPEIPRPTTGKERPQNRNEDLAQVSR